jgi:hypothetical protein
MKKLYVLIAIACAGTSAFAQQKSVTPRPLPFSGHVNSNPAALVVVPTDTLWNNLDNWTGVGLSGVADDATTPAVEGGFVTGTNSYGDLAKVQGFINTMPTNIEGVLMWMGAKYAANPASMLKVNVYKMTGTAYSDFSTNPPATITTGPSTVLGTASFPLSSVDTALSMANGTNYFPFATPVYVTGDFGVGMDMSQIAAGDTIAVVHSADGDAMITGNAFEKWSNNSWATLAAAWGSFDVELAIWPVVEQSTGIEEETFINGIKLFTNQPNPFNGTTVVNYELAKSTDNVTLMIFDATGRVVKSINEGAKAAGKYQIEVSSADLSAGTYFYTLKAGNVGIAKKMIITE